MGDRKVPIVDEEEEDDELLFTEGVEEYDDSDDVTGVGCEVAAAVPGRRWCLDEARTGRRDDTSCLDDMW